MGANRNPRFGSDPMFNVPNSKPNHHKYIVVTMPPWIITVDLTGEEEDEREETDVIDLTGADYAEEATTPAVEDEVDVNEVQTYVRPRDCAQQDGYYGYVCAICLCAQNDEGHHFTTGTRGNQSCYTRLVCGHVYHDRCVSNWLQRNNSCPTCRRVSVPLVLEKNVRVLTY